MRHAGIGQGHQHRVLNQVRADAIRWLNPDTLSPAEEHVWAKLDLLKEALNQRFFLGIRRLEAHLTVYPAGSTGYAQHLDTFQGDDLRVVSVIVYLNERWSDTDGGGLLLYPGASATPLRILPECGQLVCFLSSEVPHAVEPNQRARYTFTGWFRRDD